MTSLSTVGYEGRTADDLVQLLSQHEIQIVIDVRERPSSRKPGLSKGALSQRLAEEGLEYVHLRELGNPKEYRDALRGGWDFDEFAAAFIALVSAQTQALAHLHDVAMSKRACLLCFEADPAQCHRSLVAYALAESASADLKILHLGYDC